MNLMLGGPLEGHAELLQRDLQLLYCNNACCGHVHSSICCLKIHNMQGANSDGVGIQHRQLQQLTSSSRVPFTIAFMLSTYVLSCGNDRPQYGGVEEHEQHNIYMHLQNRNAQQQTGTIR